ncbi:PQQ-like beta-propeller repeat protein [Trueperella bialowiezensis]|uniref:PQQ enzyme repeat n=1 Tax=Trueperella bialowiezensis TaxID=312285 RepID=A0A3S4VGT6_9ACTO|nr:PQQ-like beta-propeller repeat protein [Trueperella bialowiezensis]VEI13748.1 Uncharacterised protein [Trueperella bialowiezensis]
MSRRLMLMFAAVVTAVGLACSSCTGDVGPGGSSPTSPSGEHSSTEDTPYPVVAPEIKTSGIADNSSPDAWAFNEYEVKAPEAFPIPHGEELCALQGDFVVTSNPVSREVRGWYVPTRTVAWVLPDRLCAKDSLVPQRLTEGVVVGVNRTADKSEELPKSGELLDFATGESLMDIPVLDPSSESAPMPMGAVGGVLVLNVDGSLYGLNKDGELMWQLAAPGWSWSKNLMTGHIFGMRDKGAQVHVVNAVTGKIVVDKSIPPERPVTYTSDGFMFKPDDDAPFTFVSLDGSVSQLDESFEGGSYVPTARAGALFPLNIYLNPKAGPIFDAQGNPANFEVDLEEFRAEPAGDVETPRAPDDLSAPDARPMPTSDTGHKETPAPEIVAVTADGKHALVDDKVGMIYLIDREGKPVWQLAAQRPWVMSSYLVAEFGTGNVQILVPDFAAANDEATEPA